MNITHLALRRPVTIFMLCSCLGLIGFLATRLLPLEFLPDIQFPAVLVEIPYPNSSPDEVERRITRPVEEILATMGSIERITSDSRENGSTIVLFFDWGSDLSAKGVEARDKVDSIRHRLPEDIERIQVRKFASDDFPMMTLRISSNRDLSDAHDMLNRNLKRRIARLEGISKVELYGVEQREIRIELSAQRVAAHGIDLNTLRETLKRGNFSLSAGRITDGSRRYFVHPKGEYRSVQEIENLLINEKGLRLKDIADIQYREPELTYGRHLNRKYAVGLNVFKENGANLVAISDAVLNEVEQIGKLPEMKGINLFVMDNQGEGVRDSLDDLMQSGLIGAVLSILVLYFFLRQLSMTLIVTMAVPFSILVTLALMYFLGFSLNILTMMGLMLSIGMLVDNSVVVTESIFRYRKEHPENLLKATELGVNEVGTAVLAGTLTSIIVFLPNVVGEKADITVYLSHVGVTICIALAASLLIAKTLIPLLTTRVKANPVAQQSRHMLGVTQRYIRILAWTLRHPWVSFFVIVAVVGSVAIPITQVENDMFPEGENRRVFMKYNLDNQYAVEKVEQAVNTIEDYLFAHKEEFEIKSVYSYYDIGQALSLIMLTDREEAQKSTIALKKIIREGMPKIAIGKPTFEHNRPGAGEGLSLQITGITNEGLAPLARDVAAQLERLPGLVDLQVEAGPTDWEVRVKIHRERAHRHGLSSQLIAESVATAMRGQRLRPYRSSNGEVDLKLLFRRADRTDLDRLLQIPIQKPDGSQIALSAVATWEIGNVPGTIKRDDRVTAVTIKANLEDITSEDARKLIKGAMKQIELPKGFGWRFGRSFEKEDETGKIMAINMLLALAMIYLVMAALFESMLYPLSIITGILFSVVGVYWYFFATGTTFSFMAMIGLLVLMGVVVNNGIVMIDHINHLRWNGMNRTDAILRGAKDRLRPILMTVCTTILGLVPLSLGDAQVGGNGPPYYPMARAIIGGLAFSTVVSLLALPSIYVYLDELSLWSKRVWRTAVQPMVRKA